MKHKLELGFAGTPEIAATILNDLLAHENVNVSLVITQPDRPAGRGKKTQASAVKQLATQSNLTVHQPESKSELEAIDLSSLDLLVVVAYGMVMPVSVLEQAKHGAWNIHTSLLPRWRGAAPIQRAIEAGDLETGITIMQMDAGLDTGDILLQRPCDITTTETTGTLHDKLSTLGSHALSETLTLLLEQQLEATQQDHEKACYAHKITKQEAKIDWQQTAENIARKIRAFNPFPVCFTTLNNIDMRIWQASVIDNTSNANVGDVISVSKAGLEVATLEQSLLITELQLPGKKRMSIKDFVNGHPDFATTDSVNAS